MRGDLLDIQKYLVKCPQITIFLPFRPQVLGAAITSSSSTSYDLRPADKVVLKADSLETHFLKVEARQSSASEVISRQSLQLTGKKQSDQQAESAVNW